MSVVEPIRTGPRFGTRASRRPGKRASVVIAAAAAVVEVAAITPASVSTVVVAVVVLLAVGAGRCCWSLHPSVRLRRDLGVCGWLGWWQWRTHASAAGLRSAHAQIRPGMSARSACPAAYGAKVGRLVSGRPSVVLRSLYSRWSQSALVLGPPGSGKTQWLVGPILDAPGACFITSTKTELAELTARLRAQIGPVAVFNPAGLGSLLSTFGWDPVAGCADPAIADARARAMIRGGGGVSGAEQADFWANKAAEILRCYLLAAALHGKDMGVVMGWALAPTTPTPGRILGQHPERVPAGWREALEANLGADPRTRSSYFAALTFAVTFMDNPLVAAACRPADGAQFDLEEFLRNSGTVYVVAGEDRRLAPLLTALTEAVFATAQRVAATRPGGRLDPPLAMFLDEVANMTPVPLDIWAADCRGWGITLYAVLQDLHQAQTRWGRSRAQTIFSTLPTKVVLPGVAVKDDLEALAYLAGHRTVRQVSETHPDTGGRRRPFRSRAASRTHSTTREPVVTGHILYGLPRWHAYVLGVAPAPAVVRFEPGYRRARRELRRLDRQPQPAPVTQTPPAPAPRLRAVAPQGGEDAA
jgi:type IV secretory pathway TraG/TraD family ATPase VirD4